MVVLRALMNVHVVRKRCGLFRVGLGAGLSGGGARQIFKSRFGQRCMGDMTNPGEHYTRGTALLQWAQKYFYPKSLRFKLSYQKDLGT